MGARSTRNM